MSKHRNRYRNQPGNLLAPPNKSKAQQQLEEWPRSDAVRGLTPNPQTMAGIVAANKEAEQPCYVFHYPSLISKAFRFYDPAEPERPAIDAAKLEALKRAEPRKVRARVPDGITPLVAWRAWKTDGQKLHALGVGETWEPKKPIQAKCTAGISTWGENDKSQHEAPCYECTCGIWSFKTLDILVPALKRYEVKVFGEVYLWGRIIETENGFRAQFAYPKELWLLDNSLEQLGYVYNVPIRTP